jgi:hypothetical protein
MVLHDQGGRCYPTDRSPWLSEAWIYNLVRTVKMGKDAAAIRNESHPRLGPIARQLGRAVDPDGLPRGTRSSELEAIAGALGDEGARQLIEIPIRGQADDWPEDELGECPGCGGPAPKAPDPPRVLTTTRGDGAGKQRVGDGPRCRRAFVPSGPVARHGSLGLQPAGAATDRPFGGQQRFRSAGLPRSGGAVRPESRTQAGRAPGPTDRPRANRPA